MKVGKYDKFILVFLMVVFLYSFFTIQVIEVKEGKDIGKKYYVIPTALFITPPLILYFFGIMVFEEKLKDVTIRSLVARAIFVFKTKIKNFRN